MPTTKTTPVVTEDQINAASRIIGPDNRVFYLVQSATDLDKEYKVQAFKVNGERHIVCNCKAGELGRQCWHKRAATAHAEWVKAEEQALVERDGRQASEAEYEAWKRANGMPNHLSRQDYEVVFAIY